MTISELTRRDIIDAIKVEEVRWNGRLEEPDFLARIFPLDKLPSDDGRFSNAYGDIWQHRVNNNDWDDDWVFSDRRLGLIKSDDQVFLRFLCEMLHPVVRSNVDEVKKLQQIFNRFLRKEGYELIERTQLSGKPVFAARIYSQQGLVALKSIRNAFDSVDDDYVMRQITRMEAAINVDPDLAIGTAKELVETCCKTILTERGKTIESSLDLAQLVKKTSKELSLTPEDISDQSQAVETIKRLLSNLATIAQNIAELRNFYGTGHGKNARTKGLNSRHAKLAVGAASTLAIFLVETHKEKPQTKN